MTDDELVARTFEASAHGGELRDQLAHDGVAQPIGGARPIPFVDAFPPSGRVHLVAAELDRVALGGLYIYKPDPRSNEFPLALISPALATQITSTFGQLRNAPATIELSKHDADARGIKTGDAVRVWNRLGEVRVAA